MSAVVFSEKWDKRISWALMWSFVATTVNLVIKSVFPVSPSLWSTLSLLTGATILAAYLLCLRVVYRRASKPVLVSLVLFSIIYIISCALCVLRGEPINLVGETARSTFLLYIPAGVFAVAVCDKKVLYTTMLQASIIISALLFIKLFYSYNPLYDNESEMDYSMSFGYKIIVPTLLHLNEFFRSKKKSYLILFLVELLCIIIYANRGVLLSVFAFLVYESLVGAERRTTRFLLFLGSLVAVFIFAFYGDTLVDKVTILLSRTGITSRTLTMLAEDRIANDSGRLDLFRISFDMISERPFLGWGVGGECYHFNLFIGDDVPNIYCTSHNGPLQAMVQLGVVAGLIVTILVILPIIGAHKIKDSYLREIIIVFFFAWGIPCLTVSSGFLVNPEIAIFLYLYYFAYRRGMNGYIINNT